MSSWTRSPLLVAVSYSLVAGCATESRALPPDYMSIDAKERLKVEDFDEAERRLTCSQVDDELTVLETENVLQVRDIQGKSARNQTAGYLGSVFFLPALLATDNSAEAKVKIDNINRAKDQLHKLRAFKECPSQVSK